MADIKTNLPKSNYSRIVNSKRKHPITNCKIDHEKQQGKVNKSRCPHSSLHVSKNYPDMLHLMEHEENTKYLNDGNYLHGNKCQIMQRRSRLI